MKLKDFILITRDDWPEVEQCVLEFEDYYSLSIIRYKVSGIFEIEFEKSGRIKNPFDNTCTGTIHNVSEKQINNYILLLTILTGSHPSQV